MQSSKLFLCLAIYLFVMVFTAYGEATAEISNSKVNGTVNKELLEKRVRGNMFKNSVDLRTEVDDFFLLADIYLKEGRDKEAIKLYKKALTVNAWRLEHQLKLAKLLNKHGQKEQACEKAETVYKYAEQENLIRDAEKFLAQFDRPVKVDMTRKKELSDDIKIVLVPIGKVNQKLLEELRDSLEAKLGIKYVISDKELDLGRMDRNYADRYIASVFDRIKSRVDDKEFAELLTELGYSEGALENKTVKARFVLDFFKAAGMSKKEVDEISTHINELKNEGQYDVGRLLVELNASFNDTHRPRFKGYLGVTESDIYKNDYNFLYGYGGFGQSIMSYHRFTADFNKQPPSRPRLLKRALKQGISSSMFVVGIERCSSPTCARGYPNDLIEHDQKSVDLCSLCKTQLKAFVQKYQ